MHYIVNIVKANDRKFILANRELSEDEWKGKTNIDVDLTKYKVISYIRTSKHYPMVISVKAVPTISCAICSLRKKTKLKTNVQKLHMIPGCNHFVHKKCANKRIRKNASLHHYRKKRQALLESVKEDEGEGKESPSSSAPPTNADKIEEEGDPLPPPPLPSTPPHHLPSCSSSSSLSTCSHESPTTHLEVASSSSHLPPLETNTDNENITKTNFEDKCPVIGCNKVVFMKKTSAGKEKKVFEAHLVMPILQNGQSPEYTYLFEPKRPTFLKKVKSIFKNINHNQVDEDEIIEEIVNNEAEELRLDGRSFREGFGSRRIEGVPVVDESTQTDPEISEQTTENVQGEESKGVEESVENPENKDSDSQINTENQENSEIKNKEEESSKKGKEPIEQIPEKGEGSTSTNLETNENKPETINVSYEKSTSSESDSESEYVIYKNEKLKIHREKSKNI
ncbi:unnamed protein product [Meloidogyne enterolobii]|uniref:Uncharacterized protein n=1 Tax=Meloidogyne enterolobii TaxID=390850 RepID=A0ACB1APL1_MELEN